MQRRHLILAAVLAVSPVAAAGPRDDLLRLVPDDYTFCVIVQGLRDHGRGDSDLSFLEALSRSPVVKGLQSAPEAAKVQQAFEAILKDLGVTPQQLFEDLLGDALVFTYR